MLLVSNGQGRSMGGSRGRRDAGTIVRSGLCGTVSRHRTRGAACGSRPQGGDGNAEAFTPRAERIEAVAHDLVRTPAAVTRRYYRLLALHRAEPQRGAANLEVAR